MITREELIANESNWHNMNGLKPEVFDEISKISDLFYLKEKDYEQVWFGHYIPESKSFDCHRMVSHHYQIDVNSKSIIKRENVSYFISLPPINFNL